MKSLEQESGQLEPQNPKLEKLMLAQRDTYRDFLLGTLVNLRGASSQAVDDAKEYVSLYCKLEENLGDPEVRDLVQRSHAIAVRYRENNPGNIDSKVFADARDIYRKLNNLDQGDSPKFS